MAKKSSRKIQFGTLCALVALVALVAFVACSRQDEVAPVVQPTAVEEVVEPVAAEPDVTTEIASRALTVVEEQPEEAAEVVDTTSTAAPNSTAAPTVKQPTTTSSGVSSTAPTQGNTSATSKATPSPTHKHTWVTKTKTERVPVTKTRTETYTEEVEKIRQVPYTEEVTKYETEYYYKVALIEAYGDLPINAIVFEGPWEDASQWMFDHWRDYGEWGNFHYWCCERKVPYTVVESGTRTETYMDVVEKTREVEYTDYETRTVEYRVCSSCGEEQ